ncbi:L-carnitine dehydratase/bile acid-inducible protein F [Caballeronia udeis]|uniref:L-carnitine dehydratase/bile acid-inducible protein F n=1 Tax=Caballeronia udeis TaxID=1232866 RepID=A0A158JPT7_9BURK|nr:CaiB/BaiF CoA-transferase family protein [Caballeronia udeis]SAL70513.1 L-carnitine dehydratase/bile acid-inducible protein F [Caballeronia udeis]
MAGVLSGIKVLDLSRILAGPWCTQLLADLGADVVKIERPGTGDDTRAWGPPFAEGLDGAPSAESAYFLAANRGKRSVAVDFSTAAGQEIVRTLAKSTDVVVENLKYGDMRRYGLDYESLRILNPGLIYCSITGFGQTGPYRERAGYDFVIQAMGGLMSITGESDDRSGGGPQKCGVPIADMMTGMYATVAILGALHERQTSNSGQYIDMSLLDTQVGWLANHGLNYMVSGKPPKRWGNAHPNLCPYQSFPASDGHLIVAVGNDRQFRALCRVLSMPSIGIDSRFATNSARLANRDSLVDQIEQCLRTKSRDEWLSALEEAGVPAGPINTVAQALEEPHVVSRGMVFSMEHGIGVCVPQIANPIKFSRTGIEYLRPPPILGEHTSEILESIGLTQKNLEELHASGVIHGRDRYPIDAG